MRELILERRSIAQVARRYGKHRTTIWRWKKKWQAQQTVLLENTGRPNRPLGKTFRWNSVKWDIKTRSSAPHTHPNALDEKTKKRKYRWNEKRPLPTAPGELVQIDTVHYVNPLDRSKIYIDTVIDLYSRMAYAEASARLAQKDAAATIFEAQAYTGIPFRMVQSDNGAEFQRYFQDRLHHSSIKTRHTRSPPPSR